MVCRPICRVLARASSRCPVILLTAIYYEARKAVLAPAIDLPKSCAIAFVNSHDHVTPGWTNLTMAPIFPSDLPRSAHVIKIAAGLRESGHATIVYVDFKELEFNRFDGIACANLINPGIDFAVTRHPSHDSRTVDGEIIATIYHMSSRNSPYNVFADLIHQREYMDSFGHVMNRTHIMPDTHFLMWRPTDGAHTFSKLWLREVINRSMREQVSFDFALEQARGSTSVHLQWLNQIPPTCMLPPPLPPPPPARIGWWW